MNRLADEASPYLRQHAANPVAWWPWCDEAFAEARARDVPVLLSVGYSACHWCHVMAHESFEDPDTAAIMNRWFVNVKVDREERPDVDAVYMEATQATTGHGGWPMTVVMTPDGRPFVCGTYYPKVARAGSPSFTEVLTAVHEAWATRRDELLDHASNLTEHLRREPALGAGDATLRLTDLDDAAATVVAAADRVRGGFGRAPKFPHSMAIDHLLRHHARTGDADSLDTAIRSLDAMAAGGIFDHLEGGFARYSTDDRWLVPHFEKMLYDQALLVRPYLHAWQLTGEPRHLDVVTATVGYVLEHLRLAGGGFASAEDADSPGPDGRVEEGRFQTWTPDELVEALGEHDGHVMAAWFGVTDAGHLDGRSVLSRPVGGPTPDEVTGSVVHRLAEARARRPRPGLDDKVLTEWNALMIASLAEAGAAAGRDDWVAAARSAATFLCDELRGPDGRWSRAWQEGAGARHRGVAADHTALVDAFVRLAEATGEATWLAHAQATADELVARYGDGDGRWYTTASDGEQLIARTQDLADGATPSAASGAAESLSRLSAITGRDDLAELADRTVTRLGATAVRSPLGFANLLLAAEHRLVGHREVVVCGDRPDLVAEVRRRWRPDVVLAWGERSGGPLWEGRLDGWAYVCEGSVCRSPAATPDELRDRLDGAVDRAGRLPR